LDQISSDGFAAALWFPFIKSLVVSLSDEQIVS
jgi:hypothetical protein